MADPWNGVPVVSAPAGQRERRAGRNHVQPPPRIKGVAEQEQISLIGTAAVVQYEQTPRVARGRALAEDEVAHGLRARTARTGRECPAIDRSVLGTAASVSADTALIGER